MTLHKASYARNIFHLQLFLRVVTCGTSGFTL